MRYPRIIPGLAAAVVIVAFAALLVTGHTPFLSAGSSQPTAAAHNVTATPTYPYPGEQPVFPAGPTPLPPGVIPTPISSCPENLPFGINNVFGTSAYHLDGIIPGQSVIVQDHTSANGITSANFFYRVVGSTIFSPATYSNYGFISVRVEEADPCADEMRRMAGQTLPPPPATNGSYLLPKQPDGLLTFTSISGDIVSYTTSNGQRGQFDYVTRQFLP